MQIRQVKCGQDMQEIFIYKVVGTINVPHNVFERTWSSHFCSFSVNLPSHSKRFDVARNYNETCKILQCVKRK